VAIDPEYRDVPDLLAMARASIDDDEYTGGPRRVATLREQAERAMADERWADAVADWEEILRLEPGLGGVRESLERYAPGDADCRELTRRGASGLRALGGGDRDARGSKSARSELTALRRAHPAPVCDRLPATR